MVHRAAGNTVLVNHGPIRMTLDISAKGRRQPELGFVVAEYIISQFEQVLCYMPELKAMRGFASAKKEYPVVLNKMISAVLAVDDPEINTLSAVAGSFSEAAMEMALSLGATRVIVDNGGDIACRDISGEPVTIGIRENIEDEFYRMAVPVCEKQGIFGVCTSGFGGRSFTKGIASAVTVFAQKASAADVYATYIGNRTNADDPQILRCFAEEIDSGTDIPGQKVTVKVGEPAPKSKLKALKSGLQVAAALYSKGAIKGAFISVGGVSDAWPLDGSIEWKL